jgi:ABC-type branched-subunit amino acid transport system permease subunit
MPMRRAIPLLALLGAIAFPFLVPSPYYIHLASTIAIFSIVTLGLDIVFGYTGEVSLGHAALIGIGAYTAGTLAFQLDWGLFAAMPFWRCRRCGSPAPTSPWSRSPSAPSSPS